MIITLKALFFSKCCVTWFFVHSRHIIAHPDLQNYASLFWFCLLFVGCLPLFLVFTIVWCTVYSPSVQPGIDLPWHFSARSQGQFRNTQWHVKTGQLFSVTSSVHRWFAIECKIGWCVGQSLRQICVMSINHCDMALNLVYKDPKCKYTISIVMSICLFVCLFVCLSVFIWSHFISTVFKSFWYIQEKSQLFALRKKQQTENPC